MNPVNKTAKREARQLAQYDRDVAFLRRMNEFPIEPFKFRPARPKRSAPVVVRRTAPKNRPNNRRAPPFTGPGRDLTHAGQDGGDSLSSTAAAYSRGFSSQKAQFTVINDGIIIRKRELLGSLTGSVNFTVAKTIALNPGLINSFPWLSTQAVGWEQYRFRKLKFVYYTRTGTATPGSVMLVPDYDSADTAPVNEQQAMDYKDAKEEAPWVVEFCCDLNPSAMHPGGRKFIRQGDVSNTDIKTYDAGNQFIITNDGTAVSWGKLFVEYEVELAISQLPQGVGNVASGIATAATTTNSMATMTFSPGSNGAITLSSNTNSLSWKGLVIGSEYLISYVATGSANTMTYTSLTGGTQVTTNSGVALQWASYQTFTATAVNGSVTMTATVANPGAALVSLSQIGTPVAV